jgi:hypothetical protein
MNLKKLNSNYYILCGSIYIQFFLFLAVLGIKHRAFCMLASVVPLSYTPALYKILEKAKL